MKTHAQNDSARAQHTPAFTPGPWKVMPCPRHAGKHPFHDNRWIATADAEIERGYDPRSWGLECGSLICEMRDGPQANAALIAAAPDLFDIALGLLDEIDRCGVKVSPELEAAARAAVAKGGAS